LSISALFSAVNAISLFSNMLYLICTTIHAYLQMSHILI